ncbi:MAG: DsrH/TusB family sulfur metabolism protein [Halieaceae bacterium]|jgi:sulfur relay protein TusB/DsrH|nr:DsrH/TusB family sulfur metabolism protein [Halieaceae bacterium]
MRLHCYSADINATAFDDLRASLEAGDCVLLTGPAVALARPGHPRSDALVDAPATVFALSEDLELYGVNDTDARIARVDYAGWLELALRMRSQVAWY